MTELTMKKEVFIYEFRSEVTGHLESDWEIFNDREDTSFDLDTYQMAKIYDNCCELEEWLDDNSEDLIEYADGRVSSSIISIIPERFMIDLDELYLVTVAKSTKPLSNFELEELHDYIAGQLSDGWGESVSQRPAKTEHFDYNYTYFDEDSLDVESDYHRGSIDTFCAIDDFTALNHFDNDIKEEEISLGEEFMTLDCKLTGNMIIYRIDGWKNFEDFCNLNELYPILDGIDGRNMISQGGIFIRKIGESFADTPVAYENTEGGITLERLGGEDYFDNVVDACSRMLFDYRCFIQK